MSPAPPLPSMVARLEPTSHHRACKQRSKRREEHQQQGGNFWIVWRWWNSRGLNDTIVWDYNLGIWVEGWNCKGWIFCDLSHLLWLMLLQGSPIMGVYIVEFWSVLLLYWNMYMCMYGYMYMRMYGYMYMRMCGYMSMCCMVICRGVCMVICISVCVVICMFACVVICIGICMVMYVYKCFGGG